MKFNWKNPTTISSWALAVSQTLDSYGCDSEKLLKEVGIDEKTLLNPDKRVKLEKMNKFWELAVQNTGDPLFGLRVAKNIKPGTFHALGYGLMASSCLDDALKRAQRFFKIITNSVEIQLMEAGDFYSVGFTPYNSGIKPSEQAVDSFFAVITVFFREMIKSVAKIQRIELIRRKPENSILYQKIFKADVIFSAQGNRIILRKNDLYKPLPSANPKVAALNDKVVAEYIARFDKNNIVKKVHEKLIYLLPLGEPTLAVLAKEIGVSQRSLNRYLKNENVTFREMLSETRQHLAKQYLLEKKISIIEIAFNLGYSDSSNFSRAFKKWVGVTPGKFRNCSD